MSKDATYHSGPINGICRDFIWEIDILEGLFSPDLEK